MPPNNGLYPTRPRRHSLHVMSSIATVSSRKRSFRTTANRLTDGLSSHWLFVTSLILGVYVGLPWLAPVFMKVGWSGPARAIYLTYSTQCHQLPQRSYFLFGAKATYSLAEIQAAWQLKTTNPSILRQFVGDLETGWKVAWSDRMVSMYTSMFAGGVLYGLTGRRTKPLPLWAFTLLVLPLVGDGGTHLLSDLAGIGNGFRDSNAWLAVLTGNVFPVGFYAGDGLGSFNSWARHITGVPFGIGIVGLAFPHLNGWFAEMAGGKAYLNKEM